MLRTKALVTSFRRQSESRTHVTHSAAIIPAIARIYQGRGVTTMHNDQHPWMDSDGRRNDVTEKL
jgi:hypothetical protein